MDGVVYLLSWVERGLFIGIKGYKGKCFLRGIVFGTISFLGIVVYVEGFCFFLRRGVF